MEIKNRLFPYPVLCAENDDYIDCRFDIHVTKTEELKNIVLQFEIEMDNKELLQLIRNGQADYVIHIECSNTSYRKVVRNAGKSFSCSIPKAKVNKEIYLVGMIVATQPIKSFYSKSFNEDYEESIDFDKGAMLAYKNLPKVIVIKNYEELSGDNSFFTIVSKKQEQDLEDTISFDISGDKIKILVDESIYNEYVKFHTNPMMNSIMISLLVMPALTYTVEEIRSSGSESYVGCYWFQKIKKSCSLQGKNFDEDIIHGDATSIEIAQDMLQSPIGKAFKNLSAVIEE